MADISFSEDQKKAIYANERNILVSAAAGSGKTAVLVKRIIEKIKDEKNGTDIDRFVVVTFTKAAAREMKERIGKAINEELAKDPENENLQKQSTLINRATITTMDSFCNSVVKKYFHLTTLDPDFRIADSTDVESLRDEAMNEVLEERYEKASEAFMKVDSLFIIDRKNNDDQMLVETIWKLYNFSQSMPHPDKWLDECAENFNLQDKTIWDSVWGESFKNIIKDKLEYFKHNADKFADYYDLTGYDIPTAEDVIKDYDERYQNYCSALETGVEALLEYNKTLGKYATLRKTKDIDKDDFDLGILKDIRTVLKEKWGDKFLANYKNLNIENETKWVNSMYPVVKELVEVVKDFAHRYREKKFDKQLVEFNDVSHLCVDILIDENGNPTECARELSELYDEVIIDEYQDSNYIQESIFNAILNCSDKKKTMFMVGDIKQSVYRFRNAVPELFVDKYRRYQSENNPDNRLIMLSGNYRSRACVLDTCNFFFNQLMSEKLGDVDYNKDVELVTKGEFPAPEEGIEVSDKSEIYFIDETDKPKKSDLNYGENLENFKNLELQARLAANRIVELVSDEKFHIVDKKTGKYRRLRLGDVAILSRNQVGVKGVVTDVLAEYGIATSVGSDDSVFDTVEVQIIVNILKIVDNPLRDIELISVLHSAIYGLNCDDLAKIKLASKAQNYYDAVTDYAKNNSDEIAEKLNKFLTDIEYYRDIFAYENISTLIQAVLDRSGYSAFVGALPNGKLKKMNISHLLDTAVGFEKLGGYSLGEFLTYIETLNEKGTVARASAVKDADNTVILKTFHKSKGLEYPVVILLKLNGEFTYTDKNKTRVEYNLTYHSKLGIAFNEINPDLFIKKGRLIKSVEDMVQKSEVNSEELRLLYVAMTRAREKLIMIGSMKDAKNSVADYASILTSKEDKIPEATDKNTCIAWLRLAVIRQKEFYDKYMSDFHSTKLYKNVPLDVTIIKYSEIEDYINRPYAELVKKANELNFESGSKEIESSADIDMINYKYDKAAAYKVPSTVSISELKKQRKSSEYQPAEEKKFVVFEKPSFMLEEKKKVTGAEKGTAYHKMFENIDYGMDCTKEYVTELAESLTRLNLITEEQAEVIDFDKIIAFVNSNIGKRLKTAIKINRETSFSMRMSAQKAFDDETYANSGADVLVRGVIDLWFEEADGIVLVDYKTDKQTDEEYYINNYDVQLELYKEALEKATGKKVKEIYIYAINVENGLIKIDR